jgi:arylsulfatase A-like enzyme
MAEKAVGMIRDFSGSGQPWHIRLDFPEPHLPCRPAGRFAEMYRPQDIQAWGSFKENFKDKPYIQQQQLYNWGIQDFKWEDWAPVVSRYYGIISQLDDAIGMVLKELDKTGTAENTIVIYTSDHGDMCGGHRMFDKHYVMYDDVTHIPLIVRWPAVIQNAGRIDNNFVYNCLDIPATINDIQGSAPENCTHGKSLLGILKGENNYPDNSFREYIVSTFNGQQFGLYTSRMIRTDHWKYIWNTTDIDELYDLKKDPHELRNIIRDRENSKTVEELRRKLYNELDGFGDGLVKTYWLKEQLLNNRKMA